MLPKMLKGVKNVIYEDAYASEEGFKAVSIWKGQSFYFIKKSSTKKMRGNISHDNSALHYLEFPSI